MKGFATAKTPIAVSNAADIAHLGDLDSGAISKDVSFHYSGFPNYGNRTLLIHLVRGGFDFISF